MESASRGRGDLGLAFGWSTAQLPGSVLPIRFHMRATIQRSVFPSLVLIIYGFVSPSGLTAQSVSSRPASVGLTVVVPPRPTDGGVTSEGTVSLIGGTPTAIDLEAIVGLANRPATRIEVRLAASSDADSTQVWVQNQRGEFERMLRDASIVAMDGRRPVATPRSSLRFRVESSRPLAVSSLAIPVEYRLTIGGGDEFSVWSFPSLLRVESSR